MTQSPFSLEGKTIIVTGGGIGIGKSISIECARAGADIMLCSRRMEHLEATAEAIRGLGKRALALTVDVRDPEQVQSVVQRTLEEFGTIDVLVNNHGASFRAPGGKHQPEWLECGREHQFAWRVSLLPGSRETHDRASPRGHRQHRFDGRGAWLADDVPLWCGEGGSDQFHHDPGHGVGPAQYSGQLYCPWPHRNRGLPGSPASYQPECR